MIKTTLISIIVRARYVFASLLLILLAAYTPEGHIAIARTIPRATLTCDQASFFRRSAKEKQRETRRSVGGQSGFYSATLALLYFRAPPKNEKKKNA